MGLPISALKAITEVIKSKHDFPNCLHCSVVLLILDSYLLILFYLLFLFGFILNKDLLCFCS
jgi:hypothetical protein